MRIPVGALLASLVVSGSLCGQAPTFEVASIKASPPLSQARMAAGQMHIGMTIDAARVDIGFLSLADLIPIAFGVKPYQMTGPDWMSAQRFDIQAKMPEGATKEQVPAMLQALIAERFKLTFHKENKEHPVYALVLGKKPLKLKESPPDVEAPKPAPADGAMVINNGQGQVRINRAGSNGMVVSGGPNGAMKGSMGADGVMRMEIEKVTLPAFADMISRFVDRPVVDMTELKGNYQVALSLSMEDLRNVAQAAGMGAALGIPGGGGGGAAAGAPPAGNLASTPSGGSTIFESVQELGLKLEPRKAPLETIVVDRLEKNPTDN